MKGMAQPFDAAVMFSTEWMVNGTEVDEETAEFLNDRLTTELWDNSEPLCPYCGFGLRSRSFDDRSLDHEEWHNNRFYQARYCIRCAHWEFLGSEGGNKCMDPQSDVILSSVAAKFEQSLPCACSQEIAQFLRRNPDFFHTINPTRFEKFVADVFKANHREADVVHVGGPGDMGVDVMFIEDESKRWLIQVKRRENPKKSEGFATLQNILGTLVLKEERHGIIVSTADTFSYQARKACALAAQQGFIVEMVDKGKLDRMLGELLPPPPWKELFKTPDLGHVASDVRNYFTSDDDQLELFDPWI